ncbi:MAG: hypothetical protein IPH13_15135 [Planctomycetes bacterium]|nr:hypothetical protein [Planctomycetota bacterium]MCC7169821.1 hypothetical protein [Planctomycetota bacterium]
MSPITSFKEALDRAEPRPASASAKAEKKNYAERLSRHISTLFANRLRDSFPTILPNADGTRQESFVRAARGPKKLDVNYSTPELGLGLGLSIKTINFRDGTTKRYTKNYSRVDNELRAEAKDYHERQPYSVLVAIVFLPSDATQCGGSEASSFGQAVKYFRVRSERTGPRDEEEKFERIFVALYDHDASERGRVVFFDVSNPPPKHGRPSDGSVLTLDELVRALVAEYNRRNDPDFEWAEQ